ncbi:MAG: insulinase family protein [Lachnospiraceae bacterium]|nr:insulinase family protein [Lachnospiraceae bacterium]
MRTVEEVAAYEVLQKQQIDDLHSVGMLLRHKKTGARVALLQNDDENKVFYIGFRTPPVDSCGSAHIVEHSVLCGSEKFPLKDPFVELAKGSLNTFLNAMTYPDKTVYPVASCNDRDFRNLMHVYLDAVFYPNIYREEKIFRQEGWHYEMEDADAPLTLNGVVYSEMKGAFSSPDDVLERYVLNSLYPDTSYGFESGGDPEVIPSLTYEKFLEFHKRYYHPSNSYIYLYGDMDFAEQLEFIDREYLSKFDAQPIDSTLKLQKPFERLSQVQVSYPISDQEEEQDNTYLAINKTIATSLDRDLYLAFQVLDYCICSAPGAPLKQALIDAGIGKDVYSVYEGGIMQPYFSVIAKNANLSQKDEFEKIYTEVLTKLATEGLDQNALYAALNYYEFKYREGDYGSYPKGLMMGLQMFDSWLYDEMQPFMHIEALATFEKLKQSVPNGYFEQLIKTYLLENASGSYVVLVPEKGLTGKKEKALEEQLSAYKASLSKEEIERIVRETRELKAYQEAEDTPEVLAMLPHLTRADMKKEADTPVTEEFTEAGIKVLYHPVVTNGIVYVRLMFDCDHVPEEYFRYLNIFRNFMGLMNTEHYSYADLFNECNRRSGGISTAMSGFTKVERPEEYLFTFDLRASALDSQVGDVFELGEEMLLHTDWSDEKRLKELLEELVSKAQGELLSAGNSFALQRAMSYQFESSAASELLNGISGFRFIEDLTKNFDAKKEELIEKLQELSRIVLRPEHLIVDVTAEEAGFDKVRAQIASFKEKLYIGACAAGTEKFHPQTSQKNEAFTSASQVQYVAIAGDYRKSGVPYSGAFKVLKVMLSYDYLWTNIRVLGGAYGCMCNFNRNGSGFFVSYRDPHCKRTMEVYRKVADFLEGFEESKEHEEKLTQYMIGAIGDLDAPKTPKSRGAYSLDAYMSEISHERLQKERDELLHVSGADIRRLGKAVRAMVDCNNLCTLGGEDKIHHAKDEFMHIESLFGES